MGMWGHLSLEGKDAWTGSLQAICPGQSSCCASGLSGEGTVYVQDGPHGDIVVLVALFPQGLGPKGLLGSLNIRECHEYAMPIIQSSTLVFPQCQNLLGQSAYKLHQFS